MQWYLAELVMEIRVEDDTRNIVHQNIMLFSANSPDEAHTKAMRSGAEAETEYDNPSGKKVTIRFVGISHLSLIDDDLQDGAELMFSATVAMPAEEVAALIPLRDKLRAFIPPRRARGPDYASGQVVEQVKSLSNQERPN